MNASQSTSGKSLSEALEELAKTLGVTSFSGVDRHDCISVVLKANQKLAENKEELIQLRSHSADLADIVVLAEKYGWNGSENSKILSVFLDQRLQAARGADEAPLEDRVNDKMAELGKFLSSMGSDLVARASASAKDQPNELDKASNGLEKWLSGGNPRTLEGPVVVKGGTNRPR